MLRVQPSRAIGDAFFARLAIMYFELLLRIEMIPISEIKKSSGKLPTTTAVKPVEPPKSSDGLDAMDGQGHSNIEKIRTILFGNQMRDYDSRFARLEDQLVQQVTELREDFRRRSDALEGFVRQELDSLSERLAGEYEGRASSLKDLHKTIDELSAGVDQRTHQLEEQLNKSGRELRQQVLSQGKQLREEMQLSVSELSSLVQRELQQLRHSKTDRTALAGLLTELAARIGTDAQ